jgi:putative ATPase
VIARAQERRRTSGTATIFFLDEIHRFNKAQQDALLPAVEEGLLVLIGATTENPYFEVNSALLSRAQIYELKPLEDTDVAELLRRALHDPERGIPDPPEVPDEVIVFLAARSGGDARAAYNALELAAETSKLLELPVTVELAEDAMQKKAVLYDKEGDRHYDYISAWIKSTRGSDVDASLYYLAVMLEGGEDPRFIARRMIVLASEDIGNADPQALVVAVAAAQAVEHVGMPEAALNLSQAAGACRRTARRGGRPAAVPARCPLLRRPQARPRRRLRVPPRPPRRRVAAVAAARGHGRPPLLRTDGARLRARAAEPDHRPAAKAAQKRRLASSL